MKKKRKGFTLVELIVVVAVLAVLVILAAVAFRGVQTRTRRSVNNADARALAEVINLMNSAFRDTDFIEQPGDLDQFIIPPDSGYVVLEDGEGVRGVLINLGSRDRLDDVLSFLRYDGTIWVVDKQAIENS